MEISLDMNDSLKSIIYSAQKLTAVNKTKRDGIKDFFRIEFVNLFLTLDIRIIKTEELTKRNAKEIISRMANIKNWTSEVSRFVLSRKFIFESAIIPSYNNPLM